MGSMSGGLNLRPNAPALGFDGAPLRMATDDLTELDVTELISNAGVIYKTL
jgi:hypothetical protein